MKRTAPVEDWRDDPVRMHAARQNIDRIAAFYTRQVCGDEATMRDLQQEGWAALTQYAPTWNTARGTWSVFVRVVVRPAMRNALYVQRAPVSGSRFRSVHWSKGMRAVEVNPDGDEHTTTATPESLLVGRAFVKALTDALTRTAQHVENGDLALRVIQGDSPTDAARAGRVSVATVNRAVKALRAAAEDDAALCALAMEARRR